MRYWKDNNMVVLKKVGKMWIVEQSNPKNIVQTGYKSEKWAKKKYNDSVNKIKKILNKSDKRLLAEGVYGNEAEFERGGW